LWGCWAVREGKGKVEAEVGHKMGQRWGSGGGDTVVLLSSGLRYAGQVNGQQARARN